MCKVTVLCTISSLFWYYFLFSVSTLIALPHGSIEFIVVISIIDFYFSLGPPDNNINLPSAPVALAVLMVAFSGCAQKSLVFGARAVSF